MLILGMAMTTDKHYKKLRIFVASPSDMATERKRLAIVVQDLKALAEYLGVKLDLMDLHNVRTDLHQPAQAILEQLRPTEWDIFIGIVWHRFELSPNDAGSQNGKHYRSGTEEEFHLAHRLWKQRRRPHLMLYWCKRSIPPDDLDPDQYKRVKAFFASFVSDTNLYQTFDTRESFERLVRQHLTAFLVGTKQKKIVQILKQLTVSRDSIFNPHNIPPNAKSLARELRWNVNKVVEVGDALAVAGVVERIDAGADYPYYRLPQKATALAG